MTHLRRLAANLFAWSGVMLFGALVRAAAACDEQETAAIIDSCLQASGLEFIPEPPSSDLEDRVRQLRAEGESWSKVVSAVRKAT